MSWSGNGSKYKFGKAHDGAPDSRLFSSPECPSKLGVGCVGIHCNEHFSQKELDSNPFHGVICKIMKTFTTSKIILFALILVISGICTTFTVGAASGAEDNQKEAITEKVVQYLKDKRVRVSRDKLKAIADTVYEEAQEYDIDYRLVLAVMKVESNFKGDAVSKRGARGLLQIKPSLAKHISKKAGVSIKGTACLHEPDKNIRLGVSHLSWLMDKFENVKSALHAYNAGIGKVRQVASEEDAPNTRFTKKVLSEYYQMKAVLPDPGAE
jgi:soluble lytic murein transglycosylase